jgi:hypothetical protein
MQFHKIIGTAIDNVKGILKPPKFSLQRNLQLIANYYGFEVRRVFVNGTQLFAAHQKNFVDYILECR